MSALVGLMVFASITLLAMAWEPASVARGAWARLYDTLRSSPDGGRQAPARSWLRQVGSRIAARWTVEELTKQCVQAGVSWKAEEVMGFKVALAASLTVAFAVLSRLAGAWMLPVGLAIAAGGYVLPDFYLKQRAADRRSQVERELPLVCDLIATAATAGQGNLEVIVERLSAAHPKGLVLAEFQRALQEIRFGRPRKEAWLAVAGRFDSDELRSVMSGIAQAEEMGVGVARTLRVLVRELRAARRRDAAKMAQQRAVDINIPAVVFIMIPMTLLIAIPAAASLMKAFAR